jgi:DNA-binding beta-propeller fold protein YncE
MINNKSTKWGSPGTGDGQFINPAGITTDKSNNLYVADSGNNRVQRFYSTANSSQSGEVLVLGMDNLAVQ